MKVLLLNGSPKEKGSTFTALSEAERILKEEGVETEIFHIGKEPVRGCMGCGKCYDGSRQCAFGGGVNEILQKADSIDGLIAGSPVHYAAASGAITSFLDRLFYASNGAFAYKPAAAIVCARRAGTSAALDQLNKYFTISKMPIVSSHYWNMVHGTTPEEIRKDEEGMQIIRALARNMVWLLKSIEVGKKAGIKVPEAEKRIKTNFIR